MNVTRPHLSDKRVRMAIRYAIDYDGIVNKILGGAAKQTNTFIPEGFAGYEPRILYKTDIEKAKQLMKEAGVSGFETNLYHNDATPRPEVGQVIQASLAKIGIKVDAQQDGRLPAHAAVPRPEDGSVPGRLGTRLQRPAHQRAALRGPHLQAARLPERLRERARRPR